MDVPDEGPLDVDLLADDGSEDDGEAPPSSGPASTPTSCASSPRGEEPASPHGVLGQPNFFHQHPYARPFFVPISRRGPGRPRKEGIKLTREGKIVKRYKNPGSVRGAKRHRGSRDGEMEECFDEDDFTVPLSEEPPYFPEKWPGKVCALCNLGERSQLGQGEMKQILCNVGECDGSTTPTVPSGGATPTNAATPTSTPSTPVPPGLQSPPPELLDPSLNPLAIPLSRKQRSSGKCRTPVYNLEHTDELSIIGHVEPLELIAVVSNRALYVHRTCLEFTPPIQDDAVAPLNTEEEGESIEEFRVRSVVTAALLRKCAFCQRHGASIPCKISCSKYFHFPCVLASGGFIDFQTKSSFCKDHLYQVPLVCSSDVECRTCQVVGDVGNLMTCVTCGAHYHGTCVGLAQLPGVRSGWSCRSCRVCQVCRSEAPGESRAVACEHCDKLYHATCLRPVMATVPKYGWKCKCCRVCSDCGARSPGAGPSSRWHAHYTVCDSCYQQRNKGSCCPLCRRAYRAAAMRDMIRCVLCKRYVHGTCDPDADPQQYRAKKEQNQGYEYNCPICKTQMQLTGNTSKTSSSFDEDTMASTSQDSSFADENSQEQDPLAIETKPDVGLGKGKPYTVSSKIAKKKMSGFKLKGKYPPAGKLGFQKRQRLSGDFVRKRGSKPKMRGVFGVPGLGLQRPQAPDNKTSDDDPGVENKLVLCSSKDRFVLTQDLCVMCGAIGTDSEGCLIACAQCGQTYHPYCVNIKVSHAIVVLGWRCLDCTVCEGCGSRGDEALLVLCDECDTAWHTYCSRPPLQEVPRGCWRCARCRRCRNCGTTDPLLLDNSYTECGPCASLVMCCVCSEPYSDGELIIQCEPCRRWLHASCDNIRTEIDAETRCQAGYQCPGCRGPAPPPPPVPSPPPPAPSPRALGLQGEYWVDEICLSHRGNTHIKLLEAEMGLTTQRRKRRFKNEQQDNTAVVQNADGEGTEESKPDSTADVKEEPGVTSNVKEGCMWNVSVDGPPPEGFTIYTSETGITVLRRKRQRNLNKLGIGGFVVRQRSNTKQHPDDDNDGTQESPGNKRKPRRKPRSKLMEQFPPYMQEAFFGKDLLEPAKPVVSSTGTPMESPGGTLRTSTPEGYRELRDFNFDPENSESDTDDVVLTFSTYNENDPSCVITLNTDEADLLQSLKPKKEKDDSSSLEHQIKTELLDDSQLKHTEDSTALKNAILGPQAAEVDSVPNTDAIPTVHMNKTEKNDPTGRQQQAIMPKDELLCGVNIDAMVRDTLPDMDSNLDVDEIFKGVLTDDSQESQESSVSYVNSMANTPYPQQRQRLQSPMEYSSPYHTEFSSGRSSLSPGYSETGVWADPPAPPTHSTYNQRSADKMRADESLGSAATISAVLYANTNHPEWKTEFPNWVDRCKQILKKWRALPADQKAPYLQRARDNRSAIRMKKAQQTSGAAPPTGVTAGSSGAVGAVSGPVAATGPAAVAGPTVAVGPVAASGSETVRAPNVTVTPAGVLEADAHIRVLTPSEIMRTLPPLITEQERACGQQRTAKEAEQERQWKQLQQMRQQQTQHQQQIIHDQRLQAMRCIRPEGVEGVSSMGVGVGVVGGVETNVGGAVAVRGPGARFPPSSEDINRQLRDLLQRHPGGDGTTGVTAPGQFRQPLPVSRARPPLMPIHHEHHHLLMQQRVVTPEQRMMSNAVGAQQQLIDHKPNIINAQLPNTVVRQTVPIVTSGVQESNPQEHGHDEMDIGDMDKLEQDGNIAEVGEILPNLGGEDDDELLESLTAEMGEEFNLLEFADPELAGLNDGENILDGLELADDGVAERHAKREPEDEPEQKPNMKVVSDAHKPVKSMEMKEVKNEPSDLQDVKPDLGAMYGDSVQRVPQTQIHLQSGVEIKSEVKCEVGGGWGGARGVFSQPPHRPAQGHHHQILHQGGVVQQMSGGQMIGQQQVVQRPQQFQHGQHTMSFQQSGGGQNGVNTAAIMAAMTAHVQQAIAAGRTVTPGKTLVGADGAVGVVQHDRTVQLQNLPNTPGRAAPPPPYPGSRPPPPPPYPHQVPYGLDPWPEWSHRRPLLLQEQPLLLEELLEQEKREQELDEWSGGSVLARVVGAASVAGGAGAAAGTTGVALYGGVAPPAPPERPSSDSDLHARLVYERWLKQYNAFAADQLRYYETEVQKLRKIRKSLNSKLRQLKKSGNELAPNDAAELARVSNEQQALQKHLEAARKQSKQHNMLMQEYETKQRQNNPQLVQQQQVTNTQNPQIFSQNQNMSSQLQQTIGRPMQVGQQTLIRGASGVTGVGGARLVGRVVVGRPPRPSMSPLHVQSPSPLQHLTSPLQSPLHPQHSPMHQSPMHSQHSPMHSQQSPMHSQQSPMHSQQSPMHSQQSPMHVQTNLPQQSPLHPQQSPLHHQTSLQQSPLHQHQQMQNQQSPLHQQQQMQNQQMQGQQMQNQQQLQSQQVQNQQMQNQQGQNQQLQNQLQSQQMQNQQLQNQQMQNQQLQNQQMQNQQLQNQQMQSQHMQNQQHQNQQMQNQHMQSQQVQNQQSPLHHQQQMQNQQQMQQQRLQSQSPLHLPQSPLHSPMHMQQSPMHSQQSPMHAQQSPMHAQQSPMHTQQSPMHAQQSPMHSQQSPMHTQQSPMHAQQSPMHAQQSPLPPSMSPQHFLQQLQAQRTSPQLPTPSRSPQIYQQSQIHSPVSSHSPQLQNVEYSNRFSRPAPGSPLPTRFARPPHQQGMRVAFANRQQTSPLGSPQPIPSPGSNDITRGGNIGGGGGGGGGVAPVPPGWRYVKGGLRGGGGGWEEGRRPPSILKRRRTDRIATNEDFEELIDGEDAPTRTETATKTVAVISLAAHTAHQYRVGREPPARASVSIANQTISVPVLKSLASHKRLNAPQLGSVISVISNPHTSPVIALATAAGTSTSQPRPVSILTQHQIKQKIVKTIEKPLPLSLGTSKLSSMTVTHDATLPANIFQDDAASPDSTYISEAGIDHDILMSDKPGTSQSQLDTSNDSKKEIDIESEISQQTELPHTLCLTDRTPLLLGKSDIKSPDPIPEKIPDNIMEGDDEDKSEDEPHEDVNLTKQEPPVSTADTIKEDDTMKTTIKAIANQTKEMVIGSNMQMTGDVPQESVQISIPSPTPSQERYLDDMTMREHAEVAGNSAKHSDTFEDMLCILEKITPTTTAAQTPAPPSVPAQLSPLSRPAELTSNMANVSQQLRTIMSSISTNNAPIEPEPISTQVNFENLLPSSKVEVPAPRPSPVRNDKPVSMTSSEPVQVGAAQVIGSRVNTLSAMTHSRKSPTSFSPISSPVNVSTVTKSPAQSPLVTSQSFPTEESTNQTTVQSQMIQMPALSKIHNSGAATAVMQTITTHLSGLQKGQTMTTSILGHTLLQPTRQIATTSLPFSSQGISSSQPPALVMTSRTVSGSKEIPPNVTIRNPNNMTTSIQQPQVSKPYGGINSIITTSKLLHTQLTSPLKRSKSTDEPKSDIVVGHIQPAKRHSVESVIVKSEPMEVDEANGDNKNAQAGAGQRHDESQNVLLKQLLQTSTASATVPSRPVAIQRQAPALGSIPSLEAQLARPSIPPPLSQDVVEIPKTSPRQVTTQPSPFTPKPVLSQAPPPTSPSIRSTTQCLMDVRKQPNMEMMRMSPLPTDSPTLKNVPVFTTAPPTQPQLEPTLPIKKEIAPPAQSPVHRPYTPGDLKRELIDESSQQSGASGISTASEQGRLEPPIKEEEPYEPILETPAEAKRRKRRNYQKEKRLKSKLKDAEGTAITSNGKRPRPKSRYEEDYDTFIDNLMNQLRLLPPMQIQEPALTTNFAVCPLFGSGDLTKLKNKDYDLLKGDLIGEFGNAKIPNVGDYYNTKPFGDEEPLPEKPPASTQRGFYDQEFQPITFEEENAEKKIEVVCRERDTDTPDSIVSCSSPECDADSTVRFPGLEEEDEEEDTGGRGSPELKRESGTPIVAPPPRPPSDNVTVTLTLTSAAAEDILGVLKELATLLHIPPPTAYQIVERTATPPSHRLGLYRSKGKDGKEAAPVDIQSILNGAAKFCRHCDVVILDSVVRAKASEFPLLTSNKGNADGILCDGDTELCFCSTQCYERFAWRPTNIILDGKCKNSLKEVKSEDVSMGKEEFDTASTESMETDELDMKPDIKDEKMDLSFMDSLDNDELMKAVGDDVSALDEDLKTEEEDSKSGEEPTSKYRGVRYKWWAPGCIVPSTRYKRPTDRELAELVFRTGVAIMPVTGDDSRRCELCGIQGDGVADGVSRLLNCDVDRWVHLNCALWSEGVYETVSGALINVDSALANGANATCAVCRRLGATVRCFKVRCGSVYHVGCAVKDNCVFYKNKSAFCSSHAPKGEKDNELTTLSVQRRVYVSRDEQRQVASVMLHSDSNHLIRVGGLIFLSPGHLLPHQLAAFHTPNYIYPIGYKIVRFYWSCVVANSRGRYVCWISELEGRPRFHVRAQDHPAIEHVAPTARAAWEKILESVALLREQRTEEGVLKLWPNYVTGEDLFGLTEPAVVRVLESLPGIETLSDYRFKFGRSALLEGGLCVNPAGCARCEPRPRSHWRRAPRPAPSAPATPFTYASTDPTPACPYSKQFVHTKSSQYKKMKQEWRNNVYLARSKIQGLGLYAARDLEKHTMVIEYIGEIIRSELSEIREKQYEDKNRGIYMFRLDERRVVDATLSGGLARYINHSCQPNCVTETVEVDRQMRIIIFAKRRISRGEELSYDYKFDIEDDQHKIKCMCGAPNCRKWMN